MHHCTRKAALLAAALAVAVAAGPAQADVLRLSFNTQVNFAGAAGLSNFFLPEFGIASPSGVALSGYVDVDLAVLPQAAPPDTQLYADAIRAVSVTLGNKTLGFRDNAAVSGGGLRVSDSLGWDQIVATTPGLNTLAARSATEVPVPTNPAYSYVFDWTAGGANPGAYFALSGFDLMLEEYNMLSSADLAATGIAQPMASISRSRVNLEFVVANSATAGYFTPSNGRYYASSSTGFEVTGTLLPTATAPTGTVPEPATLALVLAALGLAGTASRRRVG